MIILGLGNGIAVSDLAVLSMVISDRTQRAISSSNPVDFTSYINSALHRPGRIEKGSEQSTIILFFD